MDIKDTILLTDACGSSVRCALARDAKILKEIKTDAPAMESFASAARQICADCGIQLRDVSAFGIAQGPGSVLGTRIASAFISTIAKSFGAKIFVWDTMKVALCILSQRMGKAHVQCVAPSRKGFLNFAKLEDGKISFEKEMKQEDAIALFDSDTYALKQRPCPALENLSDADISLAEILKTLNIEDIAETCELPPDAKSLTVREYVKWKAQVHI